MATAQLMGTATRRIQVGTWIANIYVRHSYACAQGAALIADATDGRFVLGLGVSHPPVNKALGIDMGDAPSALRRPARTSACTRPSRSSSGSSARAGSPPRPIRWRRAWEGRRSATGSWMPCV
jgi:hypothetical protein